MCYFLKMGRVNYSAKVKAVLPLIACYVKVTFGGAVDVRLQQEKQYQTKWDSYGTSGVG